MSWKRRLLIAVDGSDQALDAVRYVSELFPPNRVEVVLFHVMSEIPESYWDIEKNPAFRHQLAPIAAWSMQEETRIREFMGKAREVFTDRGVLEDSVDLKIQEKKVGIARDILHKVVMAPSYWGEGVFHVWKNSSWAA